MKPRNYVALAMRSRSGGTHGKTEKAKRRKAKMNLKNEM